MTAVLLGAGPASAAALPPLRFTPLLHSFGKVPAGQHIGETFALKNTGTENSGQLQLTFSNSPGFRVTFDGCSENNLAPGGTCDVDVNFAPSKAGAFYLAVLTATGFGTGETAASVMWGSGGTAQFPTLAWSQSGATVGSYNYGTVPQGNDLAETFTLTNSGTAASQPLIADLFTSSSFPFVLTGDGCSGVTLTPGEHCTVNVDYVPAAAADSDSATLTAGGAVLNLTGQGGNSGVTISPSGFNEFDGGALIYTDDLGPLDPGQTTSQTLTLINTGPGTFQPIVQSNSSTFAVSDDLCTGGPLPSGGSCTITVTFAPGDCVVGGTPQPLFNGVINVSSVTGTLDDVDSLFGECLLS
jgi:hypothetical protein